MQKFLRTLALVVAFLLPVTMQAQDANVSEYDYSVGSAQFNSVVSNGTAWTAADVEQGYVEVAMPFDMYFGESQVQNGDVLRIYPNGSAEFTGLSGSMIAPMMSATAYTTGQSSIYYLSTTNALIIEWRKVVYQSNSYSFQLKLYPDGNIEFCYGPMTLSGNLSVLVGLRTSETDQFLCDGNDWSVINRTSAWSYSHTISTSNAPSYNLTTKNGVVYTFTQPACVKPADVVASPTEWNSANVSWTCSRPGTRYEIKYGVTGFDLETEGAVLSVNDPTVVDGVFSYSVSGLSAGTTYDFYVRNYCNSTPSAWSNTPGTATTPTGCPYLSAIGASDITVSTATISGTPSVDCNGMEVRYNLGADFDPYNEEGTLASSTTTSVALSGLTGTSTYYYYVRANCVSGLATDWDGPYAFTTLCDAITVNADNPYTQTFSDGSMPMCWSEEVIAGSTHWNFYYNGTATFSYTPGASARLITPVFNLNPAGAYQVEFDHYEAEYSGICDSLWLCYRTSPTAEWVRLAQYGNHSSSFEKAVVLLPNPTATYQLAFVSYGMDGNSIYLANVVVRTQPTCPAPSALAISDVTGNSVTLSWNETGTATAWQIAYGLFTTEDDYTIVDATTNPFTVSNLGLGEWSFYVRSNCAADDQSDWIGGVSQNFGYCTPAPTSHDNNGITGVTFGNELVVNDNNTTTAATRYQNHSDMIGDVYAGVASNISITYDAGYSYGTKIWVDLNNDLSFSNDELLYTGLSTSSRPTTLVASITIPTSTPLGDHRLRIGGTDNDDGPSNACYTGSYGVFRDYTVRVVAAPSCFVPGSLAASNVTSTSATLTWEEVGLSTQWEVKVGPHGFDPDEAGTSYTVNTTPTLALDYLFMVTEYDAYVRAICDPEGPTDWSDVCEFKTGCPTSSEFVIGEGTVSQRGLPSNPYFNYAISEQIFTPSEMGGANNLASVSFYVSTSGATTRTVDIYLGETDKTEFTSTTDWVSVTGMTKVVNAGSLDCNTTGWKTLEFVTPFAYSGNNNLIIVVDDNTGGWKSVYFYATATDGNKAIYVASDNTNYNPTFSTSYTGTLSTNRSNIKFGTACDTGSCNAPTTAIALSETEYAATLTFTDVNEESNPTYGIVYGPQGFNPESAGTTVSPITTNTYTISNLAARTSYDVYVYAICSGTNGRMVKYNFVTPFIPNCKTPVIDGEYGASNIAYNTADLTWRQPGDQPMFWTVRYADADFNPETATADQYTELTVTSAQANLTGLVAGTTYYVYIKATCSTSPDLDESPWLKMSNANPAYTFTTPTCVDPTEVAASDVTNSTAMISWTEAGNATAWTVKYGPAGFDPDMEGTAVACTTASVELTGLNANAPYEVYVKANCTATDESGWSDVCSFATVCPGIIPGSDFTATIGDGTDVTTGVPVANYGSTYCQQIFTASELTEAGVNSVITSLVFNWQAIDPSYDKYFTIWLANTDKSSFETTDFVPYSELTKVYGPVFIEHGTHAGEQEYVFDNAFQWDGTSNIVVVTLMNAGASDANASRRAYTHNTGVSNISMRVCKDNAQYTDEQLATITGPTYSGRYTYRTNIIFKGAVCDPTVTCFAPASVSAEVSTANVVTVNWTPRTDLRPVVNNFELKYGPEGFDPETQGVLVSNLNNVNTYTINGGLAANTTYEVYVRTVCDAGSDDYSNWTKGTFTTYPTCWPPVNLEVSATTVSSATLAWENNENAPTAANRWLVAYGTVGFNPDDVVPVETTNNTAFEVTGLKHSTKYEFYVRAKCSADDLSDWSLVATGTTQCDAWQYSDMPLVENFDNVTGTTSGSESSHVLPTCWDYNNDATSSSYMGYPVCYNSSTYSRSGNNHLRFYTNYTNSSYNYGNQIAVFPQMDFDVDTLILEFYARKLNTNYSTVSIITVGVMSDKDDASTFEEVATLEPSSTSYEQFMVNFSDYEGTGRYIAIKAARIDGTSGNNYVLIDDVTLKLREKTNVLPNNGGTLTACSEFVMPDTADANYSNNLNATYVIRPAEAGKMAHISGSYNLEYAYDFLYVYRGEGSNRVIVDTLTGSGDYDYVDTSSNNWVDNSAITLVFKTDNDNALPYEGFKFYVSCECPAAVIDMPVETVEANSTYTWTDGNGQTYVNHATVAGAEDLVVNEDYTFTNVAGCDSVNRHLSLTIHPDYVLNYAATICERDEYEFYGQTFTTAGEKTVTLQSVNGADSVGILTLTVNSAPSAYIYYNNRNVTTVSNFCDNATMTLTGQSNVQNATYMWDGETEGNTYVVNPHESNTYTVVATNPATGCTSLPAQVTVTTTPVPELTISGDAEICYGQSATLTLTDANNVPATYRWSNNATTESITVTPTETTTYSVIATTTTGACPATAEFTVTVNALPVVEATAAPVVICQNDEISLSATNVEGYSYSWNTGATASEATVAAAATGNFTVTVTDQKGCVNEFTTNNVTVNPEYTMNDEQSACVGMVQAGYTWGEMTLTHAGSYDQTFQTVNGCDSTVHLTFQVQDTAVTNTNRELCEGATFTFGTGIYQQEYTATESTVISYVDTTSSECPARYNLNLTVNTHNPATIENTVCDTYTWPLTGETYTESGAYVTTLATTKGCDSVVTLNLTVNYQNTGVDVQTACDQYEWIDGNIYTKSNTTAQQTLVGANAFGCDSVVTLNLTVNYRSYHEDFHRVCDAKTFTWDDNEVYNLDVALADSIQHITGENEFGCLEIALLHLDMNYVSDTVRKAVTICDEYIIDTVACDNNPATAYLNQSGIYELRVHNDSLDRDEILILDLTINPSSHHTTVATGCLPYTWTILDSESQPFEIATITADMVNGAAVYTTSFDLAAAGYVSTGCSTIEVLRLTPKYPTEEVTEATICQNGSWTSPDELVTYNGSDLNVGENVMTWATSTNEAGCQHLDKVALTVNEVVTETVNDTLCENEFVEGIYNYIDGNDTLVLTIPTEGLNEQQYSSSAVANWQTEAGCPRTVTVNYTVNPITTEVDTVEILAEYVWEVNGQRYNEIGHTIDTAETTGENGCLVYNVLDLTITDSIRHYQDTNVCTNYVGPDGITYVEGKTFVEVDKNNEVWYTTYHVLQRVLIDDTVVTNIPYTWINGETYSNDTNNVYYADPTVVGDCGDIHRLTINMIDDTVVICEGQLPYTYDAMGIVFDGTGAEERVLLYESLGVSPDNALDNQYYGFGGVLSQLRARSFAGQHNGMSLIAGTSFDIFGADSMTVELQVNGQTMAVKTIQTPIKDEDPTYDLMFDSPVSITDNDTVDILYSLPSYAAIFCHVFDANAGYSRGDNFQYRMYDGGWGDWMPFDENLIPGTLLTPNVQFIYFSSYYISSNSANNTDTILYYVVNSNTVSNTPVVACESYEWNGQTYTESTIDTISGLVNANGCDSIAVLSLTINNSTESEDSIIACDSYTWSGIEFTESIDTTIVGLTNANGCDSTASLHLTINVNPGVEETVVACDSYEWNGQTLTTSKDYSVNFTDANGCTADSVLHLTVNSSVASDDDSIVNAASTYFLGVLYHAPFDGYVDDTLTAANGCDSIVTMHLIVNMGTMKVDTVNGYCGDYTWRDGNTYTWIPEGERVNSAFNYANLATGQAVSEYPMFDFDLDGDGLTDTTFVLWLTLAESYTEHKTDTILLSRVVDENYLYDGRSYDFTAIKAEKKDTTIYREASFKNPATGYYIDANNDVFCDSIVYYTFNMVYNYVDDDTVTVCNTTDSYTTVNGATIALAEGENVFTDTTAAGTANEMVHNKVYVRLPQIVVEDTTVTICDQFTWYDSTYTVTPATDPTHLFKVVKNGVSCDSLVTLHLTVNHSTASVNTVTACGTYTWNEKIVSGAAKVYTESNSTDTIKLTNLAGCDSIVTLNLTINPVSVDTISAVACDSYTWTVNTFNTVSGMYEDVVVGTYTETSHPDDTNAVSVQSVDVVIGDTTSTETQNYLPSTSNFSYAISQQIYTADEIGMGGDINSLTMWLKNTSDQAVRSVEIYLKEVDVSTFNDNYSWISLSEADKVATSTIPTGNVIPVARTFEFDAPFAYSGTGNLLVCVRDVTGDLDPAGVVAGIVMSANGYQAIIKASNGGAYDVTNPGVRGNRLGVKNVIGLNITPQSVDVVIGDTTSTETSNDLPSYSFNNYSISQQIYTADEIGMGGDINSLTMWLKNNSNSVRSVEIYLKEVPESSFNSNDSWISLSEADKVATSTIPNGIKNPVARTFEFDAPFTYSGTGNLLVCVRDATNGIGGDLAGIVMNTSGNQSIYACNDDVAYDVTNLDEVTGIPQSMKNVIGLNITPTGGPITYSATNQYGCDSLLALDLTVNHSYSVQGNDTNVLGPSLTLTDINGTYLFLAPYDDDTTLVYQTVNGCDSNVTFHITVNQYQIQAESPIECGIYTWPRNNHTYLWISDEVKTANAINIPGASPMLPLYKDLTTNAYVYSNPMDTVGGIVYLLDLNLNEVAFVDSTIARFPQSVNTLTLHGTTFDFTGLTSETSPAADTIVYLTLPHATLCGTLMKYNVHVVYNYSTDDTTVCFTENYMWEDSTTSAVVVGSGNTITKTIFPDDWANTQVVTRTITVRPNNNLATVDQNVCDSIEWNGETYTTSGNYAFNTVDQYGCDSTVTLNLVVKYNTNKGNTIVACDSTLWFGSWYKTAGDYQHSYTASNGCASVDTLHLTINHNVPQDTTVSECESFTWELNNHPYYASGNYTATRTDANGCPAVDTLKLTIRHSSSYDSVLYVTDGSYRYVAQDNTSTLVLAGQTQAFAEHYTNAEQCDSTLNIVIHVGSGYFATDDTSSCNSYTWRDGNTYVWISAEERAANNNALYKNQTTGAYVMSNPIYTVHNDNDYDSIYMLRLDLTQNHVSDVTIDFPISLGTLEYGDSVFNFTMTNDEARVFIDSTVVREVHFASSYYCDSIHYLHINLHNNYSEVTADAADICVTETSYTWHGNTIPTVTLDDNNNPDYDHAHIYYVYDTVGTEEAPVVEYITVTQHPVVYATERRTACDSYEWNDSTYTVTTTSATYTTTNQYGCDSTVTLLLNIKKSTDSVLNFAACETYTWSGITFTEDVDTTINGLINADGCDSTATLHLTVNHKTSTAYTVEACDTYTWENGDGLTYTESDTATFAYDDVDGICTSVDTLYLTILSNTNAGYEIAACDSYEWHDSVYTLSGNHLYEYTAENGCASVDTLHLTINTNNGFEETLVACDSIDWNGHVYYETGEYTVHYADANGCEADSVLTLTVNNATHNSESAVACDSYTWNGVIYTNSGDKFYEYTNEDGCASVDTLHLTIHNSNYNGENYATMTINDWCGDYTWVVNGETIGTYTESVQTSTSFTSPVTGCDSVVFLNLTIKYAPVTDTTATVCENTLPYEWRGITMNAAGVETVTFPLENGCDSTIRFTLNVNPKYETQLTADVCLGQDYSDDNFTVSADELSEVGEYTFTKSFQSVYGCDSIITLTINVKSLFTTTINETACDTYTWDVNGETYTESGNYIYNGIADNGCASDTILALTILSTSTGIDEQTACNRYTWIDGNTYTASNNTATFTLENANGCDSVVTLNLTINYSNNYQFNDVACDSYTWNGATYNQSGIYTYAGQNVDGCDSVVTLNLTVNHSNAETVTETACDSFTWETGDGQTYTESGDYTYTLTNAAGCDSVVTLALTVNQPMNTTDEAVACDSYEWNGETYTTSDTYTHEFTDENGCEAVATLNLTINNSNTGIDEIVACDSYEWIDGVTYTASNNEATYTLTNAAGCDSVVTLNLTINNSDAVEENATACNSYEWNGTTYNKSGVYTFNTTNAAGCDSVVTLNLTVNTNTTSSATVANCVSYEWNGETYTESGVYTYNTTNANGCDSTATLILTIKNPVLNNVTATACDSYEWNGTTYTETGNYTYTATAANGCDSIVTLALTVNASTTADETATACDSYNWHGETYTQSGEYTFNTTNADGCSHVITLDLTVNNSTSSTTNVSGCGSYTWNGVTYGESGHYTYTTTNANGCDSVAHLYLTVNQATVADPVNVAACSNYTWNNVTYTQSGVYYDTITNEQGCDSISTLVLTIKQPVLNTVNQTACGSYEWNGTTYSQSGNYTYSTTAANGCDSIVTLVLTVNPNTTATENVTACDSYNWYGTTYTESGVHTYTTTNDYNCAHVITLNLTVNNSTTSTQSATACDSYEWNGTTYTESGVYTYTTDNAAGCDSVATLSLLINQSTAEYVSETACSEFTWVAGTGETYTQSGPYTYNTTNAAGCAHVKYLTLTINQPVTVEINVDAYDSYFWNGENYFESGVYTYTTEGANGCDSTTVLNLTITPSTVYYQVNLASNNTTMGTVTASATVAEGSVFTAVATANDGYHFVNWIDASTGEVISTDAQFTFVVESDVTYIAYFEADPVYYTVTGVSNDETMGHVVGSGEYVSGSTVSLTAIADTGYHFVRWSNGETSATITFTVTGDITLTAYFEEDDQPGPQAIDETDMSDVTIYSVDTKIIVRGVEGEDVYVFDVNGRMVSRQLNAADEIEFRMPTTGVYLVKVGTAPAKRVLVMR